MTAGPPAPRDFERLVKRARKGDDGAWSSLYRWLAPQILGFLKAMRMRDPEDVLGEVFLEVAHRIDRFKGDANGFRSWVFTIARAKRIDEIRRAQRRREERWDTGEHALVSAPSNVESEALQTLALEDLLARLMLLTEAQAEVLVLRAVVGLSTREVAAVTGRSTGAVEQLQHRASVTLREILDDA
jgi:RNA polymerase sigma-70 factor (ECF subfamily)